jgi:hypothetical protein
MKLDENLINECIRAFGTHTRKHNVAESTVALEITNTEQDFCNPEHSIWEIWVHGVVRIQVLDPDEEQRDNLFKVFNAYQKAWDCDSAETLRYLGINFEWENGNIKFKIHGHEFEVHIEKGQIFLTRDGKKLEDIGHYSGNYSEDDYEEVVGAIINWLYDF